MYLLEAPPGTVVDRTVYGHPVSGGRVIVGKQYWWHLFNLRGWKDITPPGWSRSYAKPPTVRSVLHIHHCAFGDMLFLTPVFKAYAQRFPGVVQTVETNYKGAMILEGNPWVSSLRFSKSGTFPQDVEAFDDAINYDGMLSRNPGSELQNVYDLAAEWAGVELPDEDKKPLLFFHDHERVSAEELLRLQGIDPAGPYIMVQYDTTSEIRNLPLQVFTDLAERLAGEGHRVILFGGGNLGKKVQWKCQSCGRTNYTRLPDRMEYLKVLCPCGRDRKVERAQGQAPWPCYLDSDRVTIRILALLIAKASAFIGPDSSGLHLAASFDRPSLGIFFSFDGDLRMRYYRNSRYMQIEVPCGPCFQYGRGPCWKHARDGSPLCVAHVTAGELYGEFTCLLKGQPPPVKAPFQPPEARPCPVCLSVKRKYLGRKGTVCYYECLTCSMIYRSNEVKEPSARVYPLSDISQLRQQERSQLVLAGLLHKRFFCPGAVALEVGCRAPHTLAELKKRGWDVHGLDLEGEAPFGLPGKFPGLEEVITRCTFESFKTDRKFTLIWMNQVFERFHEPLEVFRKVHSLLEDEGIFALHAYDGDQWRVLQFIPRWHGINTSYTGEHSVIPSERSLKLLAALTGFHYLGREPLHDPDCLFIKFQKCNCTVSEGTESTKENRRTDLARIIHETSIEGSKWSRGRGIKGI